MMSAWSSILVLSGRYDQLFTYVIFSSWILYAMATAAFSFCEGSGQTFPDPYRTVGYPVVPLLFLIGATILEVSTLVNQPTESLSGIALILMGLPFYFYWSRRRRARWI